MSSGHGRVDDARVLRSRNLSHFRDSSLPSTKWLTKSSIDAATSVSTPSVSSRRAPPSAAPTANQVTAPAGSASSQP